MGPLFVIFTWLVLLIGIALFCWVCHKIFKKGVKEKNHFLKFLGGIPLVGALTLVASLGLIVSFHIVAGFYSSYVFKAKFGFSPTKEVSGLKGYSFGIFDSKDTFLSFKASRDIADRIISAVSIYEASKDDPPDFFRQLKSEGAPWKDLAMTSTSKLYVAKAKSNGSNYASDHSILYHDPETGMIYFESSEID